VSADAEQAGDDGSVPASVRRKNPKGK